jgi:hypothetical protein
VSASSLDRTVCWTPIGNPGFEHLQLRAEDGGYVAKSVVLGVDGETPFRLHYKIKTDHEWRTRKLWVRTVTPFNERELTLRSDGRGNWRNDDGLDLPALRDCVDVDITVTPFTNTLPINRLRLIPEQSVDIHVVYVTAPSLAISTSAQRYSRRRTSEDIFFESPAHDFTASLPIDGDGLVLDYPQLFRRAYPL